MIFSSVQIFCLSFSLLLGLLQNVRGIDEVREDLSFLLRENDHFQPDSYAQNGYSRSKNGSKIELEVTDEDIIKDLNLTFIPSDTNVLMKEGERYAFQSPNFPQSPLRGDRVNWTLIVPAYHIVDLKLYGYQTPCAWGHHLEFFFGTWGNLCTSPSKYYFANGRITYTNTENRPRKFLIRFKVDHDARKAPTRGFYMSVITKPTESRAHKLTPDCGTKVSPLPEKENEVRPYIVGGRQADRNQYPWQVLIVIRDGPSAFTCGASLISEKWVLSAAHCTYGSWAVFTFLGCNDRRYGECDQVHSVLGHNNIINHPGYDPTELFDGNDISLLRLPVRANLNDRARLICMPSLPAPTTGETFLISGFGQTGEDEGVSFVLKEGSMRTVDDSYCQWKWEYPINTKTICTVPGPGSTQVFFGDSGGPGGFVIEGRATQWGVVSFGPHKLDLGIPVLFTEVYDYLEWISRTTGFRPPRRHF